MKKRFLGLLFVLVSNLMASDYNYYRTYANYDGYPDGTPRDSQSNYNPNFNNSNQDYYRSLNNSIDRRNDSFNDRRDYRDNRYSDRRDDRRDYRYTDRRLDNDQTMIDRRNYGARTIPTDKIFELTDNSNHVIGYRNCAIVGGYNRCVDSLKPRKFLAIDPATGNIF